MGLLAAPACRERPRSGGGGAPLVPTPLAHPDGGARDATDPRMRLDDLVHEHLEAMWSESPTTATWMGVHTYDDRLDDLSPESVARRVGRLQGAFERLEAIPVAPLDAQRRLDRALLERDLRLALFDLVTEKGAERNAVRPVVIVAAGIEELLERDWAPLNERLRLVALRLRRVPTLLEDSRRSLKAPPEVFTRRAIDMATSTRAWIAETLPHLVALLGDDKLAVDVRAAQADALVALDEWLGWAQKDLLQRSKGDAALGKERLQERLRLTEGVEMPIDKLLPIAERELKQAKRAFEDAAHLVAPGKTPADALRAIEDDHGKAEELIPSATADLDAAIAFARDHHIVTLPDARPKVAEMPPFQWGHVSMTLWGPFEPRVQGAWFYIEPVDLTWIPKTRDEHLRALPRPQLLLSTVHEAFPGHFVQGEAQRRAPSPMQKAARSESFVEGWADYIEQAMVEQGYGGGDARVRLVLAREQLMRAARLAGGLRFHGANVKLDDIVRMFDDDAYLDELGARREAERVAVDPACLEPALGRLIILKLRDDYRREKGDAFTLRDFHDRLLAHGAPPPALTRALLLSNPEGDPL